MPFLIQNVTLTQSLTNGLKYDKVRICTVKYRAKGQKSQI